MANKKTIIINKDKLRKIISENLERLLKETSNNAFKYHQDVDGAEFVSTFLYKIDPALGKIAGGNFRCLGEEGLDDDFNVVSDGGLWDLINQIKNPIIRDAAMYAYRDEVEQSDYWIPYR